MPIDAPASPAPRPPSAPEPPRDPHRSSSDPAPLPDPSRPVPACSNGGGAPPHPSSPSPDGVDRQPPSPSSPSQSTERASSPSSTRRHTSAPLPTNPAALPGAASPAGSRQPALAATRAPRAADADAARPGPLAGRCSSMPAPSGCDPRDAPPRREPSRETAPGQGSCSVGDSAASTSP